MARKPVPGSDDGQWGAILNEFLDVTLNGAGALRSDVVSEANLKPSVRSKLNSAGGALSDGSVTTAKLANKAVTEAKLADAVTTKLNAPAMIADGAVSAAKLASNSVTTVKVVDDAIAEAKLSGSVRTKLNAAPTIADGSIAESKFNQAVKDKLNGVSGGSGVADNSVTTPKIADNAVTTAKLASTSVTDAKIAAGVSQSKITNLTSDLADKASVSSVAGKADASHTHALTDLSNVTTTGATSGQALVFQGSQWAPATVASGGGGVSDHGALTGLDDDDHSQYHNNTRGDARYYTKTQVDTAVDDAADGKVNTSVQVATSGSLTGGGALTADRTLSLSGDSAIPGNNKYYGTSGSGTKGYHDLPGGTGAALTAVKITGTHTASAGQWLICDTTASGYDVTLPAPTNGIWVKVKKMTNNVNAVVVYPSPGSGQISAGSMTSNTISVNNWGQSYDFFADGDQWHIA